MLKSVIKLCMSVMGINRDNLNQKIAAWSIGKALNEKGYDELINKLRNTEPDLSEQYSRGKEIYNDYFELKRRGLHAFQCSLMLKALQGLHTSQLTVVDIGDSAGTHMRYLQELTRGQYEVDTLSVNLDPRAIEKIKAKGQKAILCRAEDLCTNMERRVDLFTSFQMIEHLHNPAIFFHRLSKKTDGSRLLITLPYLRHSRVGLHHVRIRAEKVIFAEDEHIFELSPEDWTLLILHSGWKVVYGEIYYQYPARLPFLIRWLLEKYWQRADFEGFWGAVLERDTTYSERYQDWED